MLVTYLFGSTVACWATGIRATVEWRSWSLSKKSRNRTESLWPRTSWAPGRSAHGHFPCHRIARGHPSSMHRVGDDPEPRQGGDPGAYRERKKKKIQKSHQVEQYREDWGQAEISQIGQQRRKSERYREDRGQADIGQIGQQRRKSELYREDWAQTEIIKTIFLFVFFYFYFYFIFML